MTRAVEQALGEVDLVHLEGYYLAQHLPRTRPVPAVLVEQNVEYMLCKQRLESRRGKRRQQALLDYLKSLEAETGAWREVEHLAAVTHEDAAFISAATGGLEVAVVPDGIDLPTPCIPHPDVKSPSLAFVANFGYEPNVDAARYLCRSILPWIVRAVPDVTLWLVGNAPPQAVRKLASDRVIVTGRVPEVEPYIEAADVIVCSLRIGGGVKVKVLEALARGKAIVTTSVGTQGIAATTPVAIRDDPLLFAGAATDLLLHPEARRRLERSALSFARSLPSWDDACDSLLALYGRAAETAQGDTRGVTV